MPPLLFLPLPLRLSLILPLILLLAALTHAQTSSPKRGLIYIPSAAHPNDDATFLSAPSSLTWYYNYQSLASPAVTGTSAALQFVPMLWGDHANTFVADVLSQQHPSITHVLGPNEPDLASSVGGSAITPSRAAELWRAAIQPLAAHGVKLGAPAVSGSPAGVQWLQSFVGACGGCTIDFVPVHWYGSFEGLASHLGFVEALFPGRDLWVTELGFAHQDVAVTEAFFNTTLEYLDRLDYVARYSWFGAFRSDVSNVGPSGAMLDAEGELTDLGAWYLGRAGTGVRGAAAGRNGVSGVAAAVVGAAVVAVGLGWV